MYYDANTAKIFGENAINFLNYMVSICFTLAMTNKLFVIINSPKVTKIKKILL
jgi:hypothetical protein